MTLGHGTAKVTVKRGTEDLELQVGFDHPIVTSYQDAIEGYYSKRVVKNEDGTEVDAVSQLVADINVVLLNRARANETQKTRQQYALAEDPEKAFEKAITSLIAAGVNPDTARTLVNAQRPVK